MRRKHLLPRFGDRPISEINAQEIQVYVAHLMQAGYAPKSIDHTIDVLSAVLRTAKKWGHISENPTRSVDMPASKTIQPKWAITVDQAALARAAGAAPAHDGGLGDRDWLETR
jgi:site-specific recombinase XerD